MIRAYFFNNEIDTLAAITRQLFRHKSSTRLIRTPRSIYHTAVPILETFHTHLEYTLALSGGEGMNKLYNHWLSGDYNLTYWRDTDFYWLNECCVPYTHPLSVYGNAHRAFFRHTCIHPKRIHPINVRNNPDDEALRYASQLPTSIGIQYNPTYHLTDSDATITGFCSPFHCAIIELDALGFIPNVPLNTPRLLTNNRYFATKDHKTDTFHISSTLELLRNTPRIIVLLLGEDRSHIIEDLYYRRNTEHPMIHLLLHHPNVHIFIDNKIMETTIYPHREYMGYFFYKDALEAVFPLSEIITLDEEPT